MDFEQIIYDKSDGIATITLNRPERMNAFTATMIDEWYRALWDAHTDPDTRVVIVTGAGDRGFCAGADVGRGGPLGGLQDKTRAPVENRNFLRDGVQRIPRLVGLMEKPYIAAVNGAAVGAGMDMASMCDIRFASENARFGMTYVRMGIIPGDGGAYYLPRIVGTARALDLIWTGRVIDAQEALAMGYVSAVVPAAELARSSRGITRYAWPPGRPWRSSSPSAWSTARPTPTSTRRWTWRSRRCTSRRARRTPWRGHARSLKSASRSSRGGDAERHVVEGRRVHAKCNSPGHPLTFVNREAFANDNATPWTPRRCTDWLLLCGGPAWVGLALSQHNRRSGRRRSFKGR